MLEDYNWVYGKYVEEELSDGEIAKELDTYPNKVRRARGKLGIPSRSRSASQKIALASNKKAHPTKGKKRSEATKIAISNKVSAAWKNRSKEDKEGQIKKMRANWQKMSEEKKADMREKASEGIRKTIKGGSKLERYLKEKMEGEGYEVESHKKILLNEKLEVDLYLPEISTVIEVDGPSHFEPIWGAEKYQATLRADNEKNGLILQQGMNIIRVKQMCGSISNRVLRDAWGKLKVALEEGVALHNNGYFGKIIEVEVV